MRSLYQRLAVATLAIFAIMTFVLFCMAQYTEQRARHRAEQELHRSLAAQLVADNPLIRGFGVEKNEIKKMFHTMMVLGPAFEFYILNTDGRIVTYSADPGDVIRHSVDVKPIKRFIGEYERLPIYGDDPRHRQRQKIFSAAPIHREGVLEGYLYVIVGGEIYDSVFGQINADRDSTNLMVGAAAMVVVFFLVMLVVFRIVVRPLNQLTNQVLSITRHGFDDELMRLPEPEKHGDEVSSLSLAFNDMIDQINGQMAKLRKHDTQRRQVLSSISHDLRTPLASLQGFIETLHLRDDQFTSEQRHKYLATALKNSKQLKHLVDQIFELAHIESGQVTVESEPFRLTELLYDLCDKFAFSAQTKKINMRVESEDENCLIVSDIAKLERVLSNLIENALRFTPESGFVILSLKKCPSTSQWQVSVIDNGEGIPSNELDAIFDLNYRARNSTGKSHVHIGLGLTISKQLLTLLGTEIHVQSVLNEGTCFYFRLDQYPDHKPVVSQNQ